MNFKKALLTLPLLALSVAPALQAADHTEREAQRRAEKAAERRVRHGYFNHGSRYNQYYDSHGYPVNPAYTGNAYKSPSLQQMDRNHDGVVTARERERFNQSHGNRPY